MLWVLSFIFVIVQLISSPVFRSLGPRQSLLTTTLDQGEIVFNSNRSGNDEIYLMNADGTNVRVLSNDDRFDSWWPRTSPNRKLILFYRSPKGVHDNDYAQQSLWVMNVDGSSPKLLRSAGSDGWKIQGHAEWSPDGQQLVMFGGKDWRSSHIYITDSNGQNARQLTRRGKSHYVDPSWSPDGKTIVFAACPPKRCGAKDLEVFTLAVSGSEPEKQLTDDSIPDFDPYYSPDGKMIGWTSRVSDEGSEGVWNMRLSSADGKQLRLLTDDRNVNGYPAWSKDGNFIYFHRREYGPNTNFGIYRIRPDGQGMKIVLSSDDWNNEYPSTQEVPH